MYGMTAAHKTLPLPAYVRVTNLQNGRSVVVRVNDRGPFVGNRIIDLSYTAAAKLDMLRDGTAMVEVRTLQPVDPAGDTHLTVASVGAPVTGIGGATPAPALTPAGAPGAASPAGAAPAAAVTSAALAGSVNPPRRPSAAPPVIAPAPVTSAPVRTLFVQAGAFAEPANAKRLADNLRGAGYGKVFVRDDLVAGRRFYRVRIGPIPDVPHSTASCWRWSRRACVTRISRSTDVHSLLPIVRLHSVAFSSSSLLYPRFPLNMSRPLLALLLVTALVPARFGADVPIPTPPTVDARSYIVVDYHTDKTLAALDPDARMEPASLTKLMTAYIVFQQLAAASSS